MRQQRTLTNHATAIKSHSSEQMSLHSAVAILPPHFVVEFLPHCSRSKITSSPVSGVFKNQGRLTPTMNGRSTSAHIWHGKALFSLFGPNMEAWSYSLALRDLDTLMRLSESPQYWATCCLHKHKLSLFTIGITGMPNATTNNSLSKYVTQNDQSVNTPLLKMWEIALPTPLG